MHPGKRTQFLRNTIKLTTGIVRQPRYCQIAIGYIHGVLAGCDDAGIRPTSASGSCGPWLGNQRTRLVATTMVTAFCPRGCWRIATGGTRRTSRGRMMACGLGIRTIRQVGRREGRAHPRLTCPARAGERMADVLRGWHSRTAPGDVLKRMALASCFIFDLTLPFLYVCPHGSIPATPSFPGVVLVNHRSPWQRC